MHRLSTLHIAWACCAALVAFGSACAESDPVEPMGGGGAAPGVGGAGGENGTTVTTGTPCTEDPCKLIVPQCGCGTDLQCTLSAELDRVCAQIGDVPVGGACGTVEKCKPGAICAGPTALLTRCLEVCDGDEDCDAPGGKCKIGAGDTAQLCTDNCNLVTNEGCLVPGMACQFRLEEEVYFTSCDVEGPGIAQSLCTTNDDCSSGHVCLPSGGEDRCFLWCDVANPAVCGALECEPLGITIGTTSYGACN